MQEVYLYQTVHILGGRSLHLTAHLAVLDRWSRELFGRPAGFRQQSLARQIEALAAQTAPADCDLSQFVRIVVPASGDPAFRLESAGISLYRGYDLRSLMPDAVTLQYDIPFPEAPTSAREAAAGLARQQARLHGASVAVRCDGDGIVRTADAVGEVMLKGVEADYDWSYFREWLVAGELPRVGGEVRTKDILLSRTLADKLLLGVGDKVEMLFVEPGEMMRRDGFKVAGVYESGMEEMDGVVVVTDIRNVQRLSEWGPDEISGYEILTRSLAGADTFARTLGRTLLYDDAEDSENLAVTSVRERYANIFDWLKAHDVNAAVVIVIMLVVAFFNMTSALLILVLERTRMIGLLKAFGMRNGCLQRIFLWRAALVTLRGLAWGNAAGLGLCLVQKWTHLVKLSSEGYLLSEVPVSLGWGWWLALNAGFVAAIVALLVIPTAVVSTVKPEETIRYE